MPTIQYGTTTIDYILHREARSDLKITVTIVNGVEVYAPDSLADNTLEHYLKQKAPWIQGKIQSLQQVETANNPFEFLSGEKLPYLGRSYKLKIRRNDATKCSLRFFQGRFIADVPEDMPQENVREQLRKQLIQWYRSQAAKQIHKRADYYQALLNVEPKDLQIRTQHKRWGTCTPEGHIYINWRVVMAPSYVLDYVIVHELAHLRVKNHSPAFWKVVASILPDYDTAKEWLRTRGATLLTL